MQTLVRRRRMGDLTLVFRNQELNGTGEIIVYGYYHPYWDDRNAGVRNQNFDLFSRKILDLKCGNSSAIEYFYEMINPEINPGVTICVVPSSDPDNIESGIAKLGKMLADNGRKDKVYYLRRNSIIPKLAYGGDRNKEIHYKSITTLDDVDISGEIVLIMDDVTTTGNSLKACRDILINRGADVVEMLALGRTVRL